MAGTFAAVDPLIVSVADVDDGVYNTEHENEFLNKVGSNASVVSFGGLDNRMSNDPKQYKEVPNTYRNEEGSCISIRDIQEVRDKVPASPATKLNEPIPYFQ